MVLQRQNQLLEMRNLQQQETMEGTVDVAVVRLFFELVAQGEIIL